MSLQPHPLNAVRPLLNERCENWFLVARIDGRFTVAWHMEPVEDRPTAAETGEGINVTWLRDAVATVLNDTNFDATAAILLGVIAHGVIQAAVPASDVGGPE